MQPDLRCLKGSGTSASRFDRTNTPRALTVQWILEETQMKQVAGGGNNNHSSIGKESLQGSLPPHYFDIPGRRVSGNFFKANSHNSAGDAPPTTFRTGISVFLHSDVSFGSSGVSCWEVTYNSFKNQERTSTATKESTPSSTSGASTSTSWSPNCKMTRNLFTKHSVFQLASCSLQGF